MAESGERKWLVTGERSEGGLQGGHWDQFLPVDVLVVAPEGSHRDQTVPTALAAVEVDWSPRRTSATENMEPPSW